MSKIRVGLVSTLLIATTAPAETPPVKVMVLGACHFGNPGLDTPNMQVDSVLTPTRQQELARLAKALAALKAAHLMVEMQSEAPDFALAEYTGFDDAMLAKQAN